MKVSVIVPVYNVQSYLHYAMDSLMQQTYRDLEIILVNDGSTDQSGRLCQEYASLHDNVFYFYKENGGLSDARNYGVSRANSEWITFLDPDDYLEPFAIELMVGLQKMSEADIVSTRVKPTTVYDNYSKVSLSNTDFQLACEDKADAFELMLLGQNGTVSACGKLYRKGILESIPFPVGKIYEDFFVVGKHILESTKIVVSPCVTYHYYKRPGSIVNSRFNTQQYDFYEACEVNRMLLPKFGDNVETLYESLAIKQVAGSFHLINLVADSEQRGEFKTIKRYLRPYLSTILKSKHVSYKFKIKVLLYLYTTPLYLKIRKVG